MPDANINYLSLPSCAAVNLNEDPLFSECLRYLIVEGITALGSARKEDGDEDGVDIYLDGAHIAPVHCLVTAATPTDLQIVSNEGAATFINGVDISRKSGATTLQHGDRLMLGSNHVFKLCMPVEAQRLQSAGKEDAYRRIDWEMARSEVSKEERIVRPTELLNST